VTHDDVVELLGVFALDAVSGDEREIVAGHLHGCVPCREEVDQHRRVASFLAFAGGPAPLGLWNKIDLRGDRTELSVQARRPVSVSGYWRPGQLREITGIALLTSCVIAVIVVVGTLAF
jgi:hypothetical protein